MEFIFHNCALCSYKTKRKYDLKRHENAMHNKRNQENNDNRNTVINNKNTVINNKNTVTDNRNTVTDNKNTVTDNKCSKCSKILSSKQYLQKHLVICKGVSNTLECHFCHKIFASYSSKSKHLKTCKERPQEQPIEQPQEETINNSNNNLNLISYNEEESKIDFDMKHLENNNIVHKLYTIHVEDAFRVFYNKLFENKNNQMVIKKNIRHSYSNVHIGSNNWQNMLDDIIYDIIMKFISETLLTYIYENTKNKENNKYIHLRDYSNYMATKGYSYNNTKEIEKSYKNHIKCLKYLFISFYHHN